MKRKYKIIIIHVLLWLTYFALNFLFVKNYKVKFDFIFHVMTWIVQVLLFYINFYILLPYILFKNKIIKYLIFSIVTLSSFYLIKLTIDNFYFKSLRKDGKELMMRPLPSGHLPFDKMKPLSPNDFNPQVPSNAPYKAVPPKFKKQPFKRHFNFFPISGLLLVYMASISLRLLQKWSEDEKQKDRIDKDKISTELSFLKQQINPHFLFNSLNSIYSLSMTKSIETTDAILKLSSILRYILYEGEKKSVPLSDELDILKHYIDLQKLRVSSRVKINFMIDGKHNDLRIEPLLLLPLIENAFKHGVDNANDSFIDIKIKIKENTIELFVDNKKLKSKKQDVDEEGGIGLKNIQRRLDLIYPGKHIFIVKDEKDMFSVYLQLYLR